MKRVRKVIFWCHLISGVIAGIVILIMSVTGAVLALKPQILRFAESNMRTVQVPQANAQRLTTQELFAKLKEAKPNAKPTALTIQSEPSEAAVFALGRDGNVYMNPYNGQITGEGAKKTAAFFRVMEDWHRWIGMSGDSRPIGKAITGFCNAAFLVLAITGLYIWMPRKFSRQSLKSITMFKAGLRGRARNFNWHNVIGFWSALVLILLTATGMVISYQWAGDLLYTLTFSEKPPAAPAPPTNAPRPQQGAPNQQPAAAEVPNNLNQLWARAEQQVPNWKSINLRLAQRAGGPVSFSIDEGTAWNPFARSTLTLNSATADVVNYDAYANYNRGRTLRLWSRFTHTGEAFGLIGQIVAGLASLGGAFLVWTGLSLALRRFRSWLARRSKNDGKQIDMELATESKAD